ncbi:hypothetical protein [Deinococcus malanensis]|nr:hypothetical protein [Deinococcus malanensis]
MNFSTGTTVRNALLTHTFLEGFTQQRGKLTGLQQLPCGPRRLSELS